MAVFTGNDHKGKTQKERIQEITEQLEAGVIAVFESDAYKAYLPDVYPSEKQRKTYGCRKIKIIRLAFSLKKEYSFFNEVNHGTKHIIQKNTRSY